MLARCCHVPALPRLLALVATVLFAMTAPACDAELAMQDPYATDAGGRGMATGVDTAAAAVTPARGSFLVLTYNVAGLPDSVSASRPSQNTPLISPLLNAYDLVLLQEDFVFHEQLVARAEHPFKSAPYDGPPSVVGLSDGLHRLSALPFEDVAREAWEACHGTFDSHNDCLGRKGLSFARHEVAPGVAIDVYNVHMDAGGTPGDVRARQRQADQLLATIAEQSAGRAVVVAGDTNLHRTRPGDRRILDRLLRSAGLTDAGQRTGAPELIDRVLYRGSDELRLDVVDWRVPEGFHSPNGEPLSDHPPVAVRLAWSDRGRDGWRTFGKNGPSAR